MMNRTIVMTNYSKPNMTNIPGELGRVVISQILATKPFDPEAKRLEAEKLVKEILVAEGKIDDARK